MWTLKAMVGDNESNVVPDACCRPTWRLQPPNDSDPVTSRQGSAHQLGYRTGPSILELLDMREDRRRFLANDLFWYSAGPAG